MSQLKQDEWPADDEPTTTEAQVPATDKDDVRGGLEPRVPPHRPAPDHDRLGTDELSNVTPDEQVD
jgi:hypothetical protein